MMLTFVLLGGCAARNLAPPLHGAAERGFLRVVLEGNPFTFAGQLKKPIADVDELVVYLEGDGHVKTRSGGISRDPTPRFPVGWLLARQDPAPAVLYLGRVGQHNSDFARPEYREYWAEKRFAPEVAYGMGLALDQAKKQTGATRLHLVGFSGGGAIAVLLAGQRQDVDSLVTVAGLLDHAFWTGRNGYQPLTGSLNPADVAGKVNALPQVHFFGTHDALIPAEISKRFFDLAAFENASRVSVPSGHNKGWEKAWPALLEQYIEPLRGGLPASTN